MRTRRFIIAVTTLAIAAGLFSSHRAQAVSTDRAVWFFDLNHSVGSARVVGNAMTEDVVIGEFQRSNIARVYQSFANPVPPPAASDIAAWHVKLNTAGITPMLLLSDVGTIADLNFFTQQLINFNNGRPANEQYNGVKLDLEPQAAAAWNAGTDTDRRDMLIDLKDTYASIRAHLDANGEASTPIYADLPVWFDVTGATIGWGDGTALTPEQERDQWFSDIANELDGITMMAFGTSFFSVIESNVNWEINNFGADVRVGLEANIGPSGTWPNFPTMMDMAVQIEEFYDIGANNPSGHSIGVDFQEFTQFFDASQPEPVTAVLSLMSLGSLLASLRRRRLAG